MIKKLFKKISTAAGIGSLLAIVIFLNLGARFLDWQIDLTKNRIHSLSKSSKEIIGKLDKTVGIKVFASKDLPPEFLEKERNLKQILSQIEREGNGKIKIEFGDTESENGVEELQKYGVPPLQFSTMNSDKFEVSSGYFGLVVYLDQKEELIPLISDLANMEYYLLTAIRKVSADRLTVIGINVDHGEAVGELNFLGRALSSTLEVRPIELSSEEGIGEGVDILLLAGPTKKFEDAEIEKVKEFTKKGGAVVVFVDRVNVLAGLETQVNEADTNKLTSEWGIELEDGLVVDPESSSLASFRTETGPLLVSYPYWLKIGKDRLSADNPLTAKIESLVVPWGSPIKISSEEVKILAASSGRSFVTTEVNSLVPGKKVSVPENLASFPIAVVRTEGVKIGVVADSDFVKDTFLQNNSENLSFALNLIDYLSQEEKLFEIRAKEIVSSGIRQPENKEKAIIRSFNLAFPVVLLLIVWLGQSQIRKRKNASYELRVN